MLYEIATGDGVTAKRIGEITGLDAGYLSRIVGRFERDGVVARERSASDGRSATRRKKELKRFALGSTGSSLVVPRFRYG